MENNKPSEEAITYIIMLSAFQVILNCQLELKGTKFDQGGSLHKVRQAINSMNLTNAKNRNRIWEIDEKKAADMMYAIQIIGEQIAKGDGLALNAITKLTRDKFDLSKCKIVELTDKELENEKE